MPASPKRVSAKAGNRRSLLWIAAVLAAFAVLLAVSGGVRATVGGFRISARSPLPVSMAAVLTMAAWWLLARRANSVTSDLDAAWSALERHSASIIVAVAMVSAAVSAIFATNSASGADASGYLSEAAQWASAQLFHHDALAVAIGAVDPWLTTPLGWRPGPELGLQSPTYPPGLPLLMALPHAVGGTAAAALIVTASAAVAVWATGLLASRLAGGAAGVVAALALAATPVFLFQSVQPMSDVPVTAAWMLTWLLLSLGPGIGDQGSGRERGFTRMVLAGSCCALAVLIRPNLAPLAAIPLFAIGAHTRRLVLFSTPVAIAGLALMWLQWQWYGSPLRSGYGTADELFALSNVGPNASRYFSWLLATTPALLMAPVGMAIAWRHRLTRALATFGALVVAAYLVYAVFDGWSYLRFLLPALAVAAVFTGIVIAETLRRVPVQWRVIGALAVVLGISAHGVSQARGLETFRLADQQRRVSQVAEFLLTTLPSDAVIVAGEQSGSLRYYTGRSIVRWDSATPDTLASALAALTTEGRAVVIALDAWERAPFRARHGRVSAVTLDWPPAFEGGTSHRTQVWRLEDRDAFQRGDRVTTIKTP